MHDMPREMYADRQRQQDDPQPPEQPQDRVLARVRGPRVHQRPERVVADLPSRDKTFDQCVVAAGEYAEQVLVGREVIVRETLLPLFLEEQEPRIGGVDEGSASRVESEKIKRSSAAASKSGMASIPMAVGFH